MQPDLHVAAAACKLAQAIHHARAEAFGIAITDWPALDIHTRHELVDRAVDLLEELRPAPRRSPDFARIVFGVVTPDRPWGETSREAASRR